MNPEHASIWVIYVPSGGWCYDEASCLQRWHDTPSLMSSTHWPSSHTLGGLLATDETHNTMWGANKVYLGYCTSDALAGDVGPSEETFGLARPPALRPPGTGE